MSSISEAMLSVLSSFCDLPQDVSRVIFEFAAEESDGVSHALVSRQVKSWVEPVVYKHIAIRSHKQAHGFSELFLDEKSTKAPDFFSLHVDTLYFGVGISSLALILERCHPVQSIAFWSVGVTSPAFWDLMSSSLLTPRRLSVEPLNFAPDKGNFFNPIFDNVTHLELLLEDDKGSGARWTWDGLNRLTNLTHLTFYSAWPKHAEAFTPLMPSILPNTAPNLRVAVLFVANILPVDVTAILHDVHDGKVDARVLVAMDSAVADTILGYLPYVLPCHQDELEDLWSCPQRRCTPDFWERAEALVERRERELKLKVR